MPCVDHVGDCDLVDVVRGHVSASGCGRSSELVRDCLIGDSKGLR